jgi:hypothetical protein
MKLLQHVMLLPDGQLIGIDVTWKCEQCENNIFKLLDGSKIEVEYPFCFIDDVVLHLKCRSKYKCTSGTS